MEFRDFALICKNGHMVNSSVTKDKEYNVDFCEECGAKTIKWCENCKTMISGTKYIDDIAIFTPEVPKYCGGCGKPYPWTQAKLESVNELVDLMDELDEKEKDILKQSAVEISTNNPKTEVGVLKIKKYLSKLGSVAADTFKEVIVQVASETAIKYMEKQGMV